MARKINTYTELVHALEKDLAKAAGERNQYEKALSEMNAKYDDLHRRFIELENHRNFCLEEERKMENKARHLSKLIRLLAKFDLNF